MNWFLCILYCIELTLHRQIEECTHCPLEEWISRVMSVEVPGHTQFKASMAYLNSSSHTTWSAHSKRKQEGDSHQGHTGLGKTQTLTLRSIKVSSPSNTAVDTDVLLASGQCVCVCNWQHLYSGFLYTLFNHHCYSCRGNFRFILAQGHFRIEPPAF